MILAEDWVDFRVLDAGNGEKLEKWGDALLLRPDPQAIWPAEGLENTPGLAGRYHRARQGGGRWQVFRELPRRWVISWRDTKFYVGPMGFKHTGLFPEQAGNWSWMRQQIRDFGKPCSVLNLFAYTGGATLAALREGASVTHVDASKGMLQWAKDNVALNGLEDRPVRYIMEDCMKFVLREGRRGRKYQGILLDPPSYGRGPDGSMWRLEEDLYPLLTACAALLDDEAAFFLLNSYTTGLQPALMGNLLTLALGGRGGNVTAEEVCLPVDRRRIVLPCGAAARWTP
ncbi:MAG: class I SAM-dependent methyltransferase [Christensenellales bacterium]|jgi:23S rRNA (cytosine1962-C5)-methyltransferase